MAHDIEIAGATYSAVPGIAVPMAAGGGSALYLDADGYVTLATSQTISGAKTFTGGLTVSGGNAVASLSTTSGYDDLRFVSAGVNHVVERLTSTGLFQVGLKPVSGAAWNSGAMVQLSSDGGIVLRVTDSAGANAQRLALSHEKLTWGGYEVPQRYALAGHSGVTNDKLWFKVASLANPNTAYGDYDITFYVRDASTSASQGILNVHWKNNGSNKKDKAWAQWLSVYGFDPACFVLCYDDAGDVPVVELWTRIDTAYYTRRFAVLSEGGFRGHVRDNDWELLRNYGSGETDIPVRFTRVLSTANSMVATDPNGGNAYVRAATSGGTYARMITMAAHANGSAGLYDNNFSKWVVGINGTGVAVFRGTATDASSLGGSAASVYAKDVSVLHSSGAETIIGTKTFSGGITMPVSSGASSMSGGVKISITSGATTRNTNIPAADSANWDKFLRGDGEWAGVASAGDASSLGGVAAANFVQKTSHVRCGSVEVYGAGTSVTSGQTRSVNITFSPAFDSVPMAVVVTTRGGSGSLAAQHSSYVYTKTASSCALRLKNTGGAGSATAACYIDWIAVNI